MVSVIEMKRVRDLLGLKFFVPRFQRGYRWKEEQVTQLLDDIWGFVKSQKNSQEFYCLQPIVVKKDGDLWHLIDGQQRLTTLYIILQSFCKEPISERYGKELFSLTYETRPESADFLSQLVTVSDKIKNVDFHFMVQTYQTANKWLKDNQLDGDDRDDIVKTIMGKDGVPAVKIIWYEADDEPEPLFLRLNIGKISLTNAELLKALILKPWGGEDLTSLNLRQIRIAEEWDQIEKRLRQDNFWSFIYPRVYTYPTRIDYLFDIIADNLKKGEDRSERYTFNHFYKELNEKTAETKNPADILWERVKNTFLRLETCYENRELYHLIGFLISEGICSMDKILTEQGKKTKKEFLKWLKDQIGGEVSKSMDTMDKLEDLSYDGDKSDIRSLLLLFNIASIQRADHSQMRFPFDIYRNLSWDVEHITPQTHVDLEHFKDQDRKTWLEMFKDYYHYAKWIEDNSQPKAEGQEKDPINPIMISINNLADAKKIDAEKFKELFELVKTDLKVKDRPPNKEENRGSRIGNLTLLTSNINRSYKNAWYPLKRKRILQEEGQGTFILPCTHNVFVKAYSRGYTNLLEWNDQDEKNYILAIQEMINKYLDI